ncbi:polyketide synthase dehydratase domain-containing protein [Lentzea sp. NPDC005914]|uniref:polyketide synthase dehydratase domain-containing protein n=1 Tax=Lentzea sp. NPDC005914 TaxID=3154572 RepID=UPI0033C4A0E4
MLLELVSARTGRPAAVLTEDLYLATDLRLDSLARVELLAALRVRVPGLPEITIEDLLGFRTLGELRAAVEGRPHRTRHVRTMKPSPAPGLRTADLRGTLVITDDGRGTAQQVQAGLAAQGIAATVVDEVPYGATGVIFLGGLRDDVTHVHAEALHAAREERRLFVTVQDTGGDFGQSGTTQSGTTRSGTAQSGTTREQAAGLQGLARHLKTEWPDSTIRALDVPRGPHTAQHITTELLHGGATEAAGYPQGRHELVTEPKQLPDPDGTTHNVLVATGGSPVLIALARGLRPKIVLLGPEAVEAKMKRAILNHTNDFRVTHLDNLDAVRGEWGPITGIVHDARSTPHTALEAVLEATAADPVAKVCVVLASPGDRTQAMANETLMCLAAAHGWSTLTSDDDALVREFTAKGALQLVPEPAHHDFRAEVWPSPLTDESHSPISWMIEWFVAASGATALREVSLLRDPGTGTGPITVRGHGKRLALVSNVTHGRARIAEPGPPNPPETASAVTVRGARHLGWPLEHSRTDPAATDECLRLAAIWAREEFGGTAVVTNVSEVRVHRTGLLSTPGKVTMSAGRVHDGQAECDVLLSDADGSARLELLGVRMLRHPR